jgi:hypothetical protein
LLPLVSSTPNFPLFVLSHSLNPRCAMKIVVKA